MGKLVCYLLLPNQEEMKSVGFFSYFFIYIFILNTKTGFLHSTGTGYILQIWIFSCNSLLVCRITFWNQTGIQWLSAITLLSPFSLCFKPVVWISHLALENGIWLGLFLTTGSSFPDIFLMIRWSLHTSWRVFQLVFIWRL